MESVFTCSINASKVLISGVGSGITLLSITVVWVVYSVDSGGSSSSSGNGINSLSIVLV